MLRVNVAARLNSHGAPTIHHQAHRSMRPGEREGGQTMTTPHRVTETVPDSISAREHITLAHIVQRDCVRASIIAVPGEPSSRGTTHTPRLDYPTE